MATTRKSGSGKLAARAAFTLLELLIVIAIITLLAAISLAIGAKVLSGGRQTLTENVVRVMDNALNSYITDGGDRVPDALVEHPASSGGVRWQPVADVRRGDRYDDEMVNSSGWFIYQMKDVSSVTSAVSGLASKVVRQYSPRVGADGEPLETYGQPLITTAFDGFGNPIRYVHPTFDGVLMEDGRALGDDSNGGGVELRDLVSIASGDQFAFDTIRRNMKTRKESSGTIKVADSDGGLCPNNRPYFYSAGADGDPSTTDDNVYITKPQVQAE